jgi:DNA-binding LacI/PurR family transcriptional regulator
MATIKDVARESGVCPATVSQVLSSGKRPVKAETRERILRIAKALDYLPNAVAQGLVQKRMNTIGLVFAHGETSEHNSPFLLMLLDGIIGVCAKKSQSISLCPFEQWDMSLDYLPKLIDGRCDGVIILLPPDESPIPQKLLDHLTPFVIVAGDTTLENAPIVDVDNVAAAYEATNYLIDLGHSRIGFMRHRSEYQQVFALEREQGYRKALEEKGLVDESIADLDENDLDRLTASGGMPTAIFCAYDVLAIRIMEKLRLKGIRIPEDISIIGFDDVPNAASSNPPLTTVRQPTKELGAMAAELLVDIINGNESAPRRRFLSTTLVVRQSVAPPPQAAFARAS